jgi:carboxyl-terminal processing protease
VAVTIARYHTPSGRDINKEGIHPDVVLELNEAQQQELTRNRDRIGTLGDPQFAKGVEVLGKEIAAKRGTRAQSGRF